MNAYTGRPSLAIWTTAKDAMLTLGGAVTIGPKFQTADAVLRRGGGGFSLIAAADVRVLDGAVLSRICR
jgi:hypothetical protein